MVMDGTFKVFSTLSIFLSGKPLGKITNLSVARENTPIFGLPSISKRRTVKLALPPHPF